jgi:hypothetical protein
MRNYSLESFYFKIRKDILLIESYSEIPELSKIIKACRLVPQDKVQRKITIYRDWIDEFGNKLSIDKNKKPIISLNDLSIDRSKLPTSDLYYGLDLDRQLKISKLLYICYGQDDDDFTKMYCVTYLGLDNYLRSFINFGDGEWIRVSPLILGMKHLSNIFTNLDVRYFIEFPNKEKLPFPCLSGRAWLSCIPVPMDLERYADKEHEALYSVIKQKGK